MVIPVYLHVKRNNMVWVILHALFSLTSTHPMTRAHIQKRWFHKPRYRLILPRFHIALPCWYLCALCAQSESNIRVMKRALCVHWVFFFKRVWTLKLISRCKQNLVLGICIMKNVINTIVSDTCSLRSAKSYNIIISPKRWLKFTNFMEQSPSREAKSEALRNVL